MSNYRFPSTRMRRMREHEFSRRMMREHTLTSNDLIYPLFIIEGEKHRETVTSMPGVERLTIDELVVEAKQVYALGCPGIVSNHGHGFDSVGRFPENIEHRLGRCAVKPTISD